MSTIHPLEIETPTPTVTHYQEVAAQLRKALNDAQALIPTFAPAHPATLRSDSLVERLSGSVTMAAVGTPLAIA